MEGALPACLVEDVDKDVAHEAQTFADALLVDLVGGGFKGPIDEHGAAYNIFAWNEPPETPIEAFGAVVAHGKDFAGRNDEVAVDDVVGEIVGPACSDLIVGTGGYCGKVIAIGVESVLGVAVVGGHSGLRLVLGDAIKIDDAVAKVDTVAWNADGALDEEEVRLARLEEDNDVSAADVTIESEWRPLCGRGERDAVYEDVVADEQRLDHGCGRNLEVLENKGHDEQTDRKDGANGGEGLEWSFGAILLGCFEIVHFGCCCVGQDGSPVVQLPVYR